MTRIGISVVLFGIGFTAVRKALGMCRPGELKRLERKAGFTFGGSPSVSSPSMTWCIGSRKLMVYCWISSPMDFHGF